MQAGSGDGMLQLRDSGTKGGMIEKAANEDRSRCAARTVELYLQQRGDRLATVNLSHIS